ncbi:L,D-transpeptidase [Rhizobium halophytocola]|uniref:Lipoprotein-anchoring transpeptidase ErfK/SrfK n=1 Tax=Rhizobium halophytocola TaxID=735519 RepID=A0ABS4DU74_9HYPH|nr:L,D-transpeptidase [Rhizobium halophytocola]MBP1849234.1 lipoprotein-anchoring transpeptidase ErfK/SrfK [Rhizobium halophytocola]
MKLSRRSLLVGTGAALVGANRPGSLRAAGLPGASPANNERVFDPKVIYALAEDNGITLPAISYRKLKPRFYRQLVKDPTGMAPGTIVVSVADYHLHLVLGDGMAMRYGIGVGKAGFAWTGTGVIDHKRVWPSWTPTADMRRRLPELNTYAGGMSGGLENPLGARALYIYQGSRDTLYRIHGTPEWWSIGRSVSSGCIRLINQDAIDLSRRVDPGARVVVT